MKLVQSRLTGETFLARAMGEDDAEIMLSAPLDEKQVDEARSAIRRGEDWDFDGEIHADPDHMLKTVSP